MANYYSDHPEIEFHLNHPLMKRVVDLKERNYAEKDHDASEIDADALSAPPSLEGLPFEERKELRQLP